MVVTVNYKYLNESLRLFVQLSHQLLAFLKRNVTNILCRHAAGNIKGHDHCFSCCWCIVLSKSPWVFGIHRPKTGMDAVLRWFFSKSALIILGHFFGLLKSIAGHFLASVHFLSYDSLEPSGTSSRCPGIKFCHNFCPIGQKVCCCKCKNYFHSKRVL